MKASTVWSGRRPNPACSTCSSSLRSACGSGCLLTPAALQLQLPGPLEQLRQQAAAELGSTATASAAAAAADSSRRMQQQQMTLSWCRCQLRDSLNCPRGQGRSGSRCHCLAAAGSVAVLPSSSSSSGSRTLSRAGDDLVRYGTLPMGVGEYSLGHLGFTFVCSCMHGGMCDWFISHKRHSVMKSPVWLTCGDDLVVKSTVYCPGASPLGLHTSLFWVLTGCVSTHTPSSGLHTSWYVLYPGVVCCLCRTVWMNNH